MFNCPIQLQITPGLVGSLNLSEGESLWIAKVGYITGLKPFLSPIQRCQSTEGKPTQMSSEKDLASSVCSRFGIAVFFLPGAVCHFLRLMLPC